jgi:hypothetical protein
MPLVPFDLELPTTPLPPPVAAWLAATKAHVDAWLADPARVASGYVPCDHELVYRGLAALRRDAGNGRRFVEFGSGFGIVTGMAASLGFEAHGIEIDRQLVAASRELLAAHSLRASGAMARAICISSSIWLIVDRWSSGRGLILPLPILSIGPFATLGKAV